MRAIRCVVVALLVFGVAGGVSAGQHEKQEPLMKEVTRIGDDLAEAMVANDVERLLAMYAEGAISLPNYSPRMEGIEAFRESHAQMEATGMKVVSFDSAPTDVWQAGDQVIEIGKFEIALEMGGMPIEDRGKYLTIYERDAGGELKIKVETWNSDVNPMMAGMMGGPEGEPEAPPTEAEGGDQDADQKP